MRIDKRRPAFEYGLINDTEDLFVNIFDITPVALILLSTKTTAILKANNAALKLLRSRTIQMISKEYQTALLSKFSDEKLNGKNFLEIEVRLRSRRGAVMYLTAKARRFVADQIILTLEDVTRYKKKEKELLKLAQRDGLTGVLNHKTIIQRFSQELRRARKFHLPLACFMFDIDDFKAINDAYGHLQGDLLLKKVVQVLKINTRETDFIGRYGGDEFLVIMPETPISESWIPAKRIHSYFSKNNFFVKSSKVKIRSTFSIGISGFPLKGLDTVKDIIQHADKGLYESKLKGGNKIIFQSV